MSKVSTLGRSAEVLLVEDDLDDVELTRASFHNAAMKVSLHHVEDGTECLKFLNREGDYENVPRPDIILLDINLPIMGGRETLANIKQQDAFKDIPVIVLTTSSNGQDVIDMYREHCAAYLVKPLEYAKFQETIKQLSHFWFELVVLPQES